MEDDLKETLNLNTMKKIKRYLKEKRIPIELIIGKTDLFLIDVRIKLNGVEIHSFKSDNPFDFACLDTWKLESMEKSSEKQESLYNLAYPNKAKAILTYVIYKIGDFFTWKQKV